MYRNHYIAVIIPALNEERSIGKVIAELPGECDTIIVCDNGSTDATAEVAAAAGARLVHQPERGYGAACLAAVTAAPANTDILLYIDADYSDFPAEAPLLLDPIVDGRADLVIGSRTRTAAARSALTPLARFGNWLAPALIRLFWGARYTDLGPFRAIRYTAYRMLDMRDRNFGWTVEMQIKAARRGLRSTEVAVSYRPRIGVSKISGAIGGSIKAGVKILYLIVREALTPRRQHSA
ncbi:MAG TPA: glycosyltransferase family 2 protein [candidate division Zixibacteria bacterium]|nr:glycosyltransferase family 2 protein [candidate division Zixibacteria bacterium]